MGNRLFVTGMLLLLLFMTSPLPAQQTKSPLDRTATLKVGDEAPDFTLNDQNGKTVRLADYRGKQGVVLAFFVLAFTGG